MKDLVTFGLVAFSAIFFVVDPIAALPMFVAMTARDSIESKRTMAMRASVTAGLTLSVFAVAGGYLFRFFGISLGSFRIAGGVLLFLLALDMMQAQKSRMRSTPEEEREGIEKEDVAIIPLAIPLLSGPGAIATVMVLMAQHHLYSWHSLVIFLSIALTVALTWLMLRGSSWVEQRVSKTLLNIVTRLMGLILAAVAVEFVVGGLHDVLPTITGAAAAAASGGN